MHKKGVTIKLFYTEKKQNGNNQTGTGMEPTRQCVSPQKSGSKRRILKYLVGAKLMLKID